MWIFCADFSQHVHTIWNNHIMMPCTKRHNGRTEGMKVSELTSVLANFSSVVVRYGKKGYFYGFTWDMPEKVANMEVVVFHAGAENSDGSTMMVAEGIMEDGITIVAR